MSRVQQWGLFLLRSIQTLPRIERSFFTLLEVDTDMQSIRGVAPNVVSSNSGTGAVGLATGVEGKRWHYF